MFIGFGTLSRFRFPVPVPGSSATRGTERQEANFGRDHSGLLWIALDYSG
jgi:hypothetical protein